MIDNIGNNFKDYALWLAQGGDASGDTQGAVNYITGLIDASAGGPIRLGCSSQGCAKVNAALSYLATEGGRLDDLKRIHLDAFGAGTRFSAELRSKLYRLDSYANPGDIFVALPFGERLFGAQTPPSPRWNPWPSKSHEYGAYCTQLKSCP